jgi:hypothetical protein
MGFRSAFCRRDHSARDDELEGLLDGHLQAGDAVFRDHDVVPRRGVRGGGDEEVDAASAGFFPQLAGGGSRHEGHRVETLAGKLDEDDLLEALPFLAHHGLNNLLDGLVDPADQRNPVDERLGQTEDLAACVARREQAGDEDQDKCCDDAQPGDPKPQERFGMDRRRHDPQQAIHEVDQEDQDVDRQPDGHRDGEAGEKDVFKFRLHGMASPNKKGQRYETLCPDPRRNLPRRYCFILFFPSTWTHFGAHFFDSASPTMT